MALFDNCVPDYARPFYVPQRAEFRIVGVMVYHSCVCSLLRMWVSLKCQPETYSASKIACAIIIIIETISLKFPFLPRHPGNGSEFMGEIFSNFNFDPTSVHEPRVVNATQLCDRIFRGKPIKTKWFWGELKLQKTFRKLSNIEKYILIVAQSRTHGRHTTAIAIVIAVWINI